MTSADGNDFVPSQEKLEWVTPKISLMEAMETDGLQKPGGGTETGGPQSFFGPS